MFNLATIFGNKVNAQGRTQQTRSAPSMAPPVHQAQSLPIFGAPTYAHIANSFPQFNGFPTAPLPGNSAQGRSVAPPAFMPLPSNFAAFPGQLPIQPVPFGAPYFGHPGIPTEMQKAEYFRPIMNEVFGNLRSPGIIENGEQFRARFVEFIHLFNCLSIGAQTLLRVELSTQLCATLIAMTIYQNPSALPQPAVQTSEMVDNLELYVCQKAELQIDTEQAINAGPTPPITPATLGSTNPSSEPVQETPKIKENEREEEKMMEKLDKLWEGFQQNRLAGYVDSVKKIHAAYKTAILERNARIEELEAHQPIRRKRGGAKAGDKAPSVSYFYSI
ncbi:hypothetical protein CRE_06537 [Caenorhabditis remanei]|uniref:Uncharacterized protein n=1 Tax=Caenorhabditis remanei TaxID=31234 RepID=E3M1G0_CAERE|nr:hypothetical protein CRE_06537 [Caenorhabditis remanei]